MKAIINGVIIKDNELITDKVLLFDEKIVGIIDKEKYLKEKNNIAFEYDAKGDYVCAGFIDQHVHGYGGFDVMDDENAIIEIKKLLVQNGVTSFLPTTLTASIEKLNNVCESVRKLKKGNKQGAKIIGVHLEGPFINSQKKGAQNEKYIVKPSEQFVVDNIDVLKIITLAPEIDGSLELIEKYSDKINFQIGHTNASFDEASKGIKKGANGFTHTFNAMTGIHHRDLGAVGACLMSDVYAELICDNIHINPNVYDFVIKNKGYSRVLLITDCMRAGGLENGEYDLAGLKTILKDGACRLVDGTLAGSALKMNIAVKNMVESSSEAFVNCIKMANENQAKYLGIENHVGKIEIGFDSDIVIIDKEFSIKKTFVDGEIEYEI